MDWNIEWTVEWKLMEWNGECMCLQRRRKTFEIYGAWIVTKKKIKAGINLKLCAHVYVQVSFLDYWTISGTKAMASLVPRPLPDFISQPWRKIGRRPGTITTSRAENGGLDSYVMWTRFHNDGNVPTQCAASTASDRTVEFV